MQIGRLRLLQMILALQCFGVPIEEGSMEEDLAKYLPYRNTLQFSAVFLPIHISVIAKPVGHTFRHAHCLLLVLLGIDHSLIISAYFVGV